MKTPAAVISAAAQFVSAYGPRFEHLGTYRGQDVFAFQFPKSQEVGMPFIYLYKEGQPVKELTDEPAQKIIILLSNVE